MSGSILLLQESVAMRPEALRYALELAARTDASVVVLIALPVEAAAAAPPGEDWAASLEAAVRAELREHLAAARPTVPVEAVLRVGDQRSEVMKYLAAPSGVRAIVWGGPTDAAGRRASGRSPHWLARIENAVECPLLVPSLRRRGEAPRPASR